MPHARSAGVNSLRALAARTEMAKGTGRAIGAAAWTCSMVAMASISGFVGQAG